ncbi:alpha/beta hydrolase (plasmid) [Shinella sp. H4-D48]|uniref:alpha/beta hydrolase n=1 Tax=Shinella sp. H4-D48 TaxID=2925841 RepID=UPI001F531B84|nr:alpha/beta hydrolase [Shinella sp. H4-D48]UNK39963.1 alpha/beta hydrolase [Shinella sp. H4-D48]
MTKLFAGYESQAALDAAYDVESSVPDFSVYARQFMADSAAAEAAIADKQLGISYGATLMENLDLYRPSPAPTKAPIFIFVHGGAWKSLTSRVFSMVAPGPVAAGACVVNVTYDLCPTVEMSEIVRQVRAAVAWTYRNAESFGGDPDRIVLGGHSAGGHLTATTLLTDWSRYGLPDDIVKAGFAISGLFDLTPLAESFLQPDLRLTPMAVQEYSPVFNVRSDLAPLALTWGDADPEAFAGHSQRLEAAWKAAGNRASSFILPQANHFEVLEGFKTPDGRMTQVVMDLFEGKLPD